MINIRPLSEAEVDQFNRKAKTQYWSFPIYFSIATGLIVMPLLVWLFSAPWEIACWTIAGVWFIFIGIRIFAGGKNKLPINKMVIERRGRVVQSEMKENRPLSKINMAQYVEITLESAPIPERYVQQNSFIVWKAMGMYYFNQDELLRYLHKDLIGKEVRLTYLADDGTVMAFDTD